MIDDYVLLIHSEALEQLDDYVLSSCARKLFGELARRNEIHGRTIANEAAIAAMTDEQLDRLCRFASVERTRRMKEAT